jgi:hypothetical protein
MTRWAGEPGGEAGRLIVDRVVFGESALFYLPRLLPVLPKR